MNALRRDIKQGETVILKVDVFGTETGTDRGLRFVCDGSGFGMRNVNIGSAIFGTLINGEIRYMQRIDGMEIDRKATERYQAEQAAQQTGADTTI